MVVDDELATCELVGESIKELGYNYVTAGDGVEALDAVGKHDFDLIVTDIAMPRMGGLELIEQLRAQKSKIPIVIITANSDFATAQKAIRLKVSDYLVKPFESLAEVQAAVRRAIEIGSTRREPEALINEMQTWTAAQSPGPPPPKVGEETAKEPSKIGDFTILEVVGKGGMGTVYKARHELISRVIALKVLSKEHTADRQYIKRFLLESRIAIRLDHPHIVRGLESGRAGPYYYIAMEFIDGGPVSQMLQEGGLPETDAIHIARQIARALDHIWALRLVHRDVKPSNILITSDNVAKLADLGIAKQVSGDATQLTATGFVVGSPHYASPEQVNCEKNLDIRSDIYSLGVTLYHMVIGHPPFDGKSIIDILVKHRTEEPIPAHVANRNVSVGTSSVISKMMQKDPGNRYQDAQQLLDDLIEVYHGKKPDHAPMLT